MEPFISAIVTAHDRKQYLRRAVASVANQTLSRKHYEIIVVKNFKDPKTDSYLRKIGAKMISTGDHPLGHDYVLGMRAARGDVLTFLDDDDLYDRRKLAKVYEVFKDPDICYYHNGIVHMDENGRKLDTDRNDAVSGTVSSQFGDPTKFDRGCMGAVAISADIAKRHTSTLKSINTNPEMFMFFVAFASNRLLSFGSDRFTYYTVHTGTMSNPAHSSFDEFRSRRRKLYETDMWVFRKIAEVVGRPMVERYARHELAYHKAAINLVSDRDVYRLSSGDYVNLLGVSVPVFLASLAHRIFPKVTSRLYYEAEKSTTGY